MAVDKYGRSHKPAGLPQHVAGTYDVMSGVGADDDLASCATSEHGEAYHCFDGMTDVWVGTDMMAHRVGAQFTFAFDENHLNDDEWQDALQWAAREGMADNSFNTLNASQALDVANKQNKLLAQDISRTCDEYQQTHRLDALEKIQFRKVRDTAVANWVDPTRLHATISDYRNSVKETLQDELERIGADPASPDARVAQFISEHPEVADYVNDFKYDMSQVQAVADGLQFGVDVSQYNDPDLYTGEQMRQVYSGLRFKVDVSLSGCAVRLPA